jgi:pimeloyl-ACP methyl ester carboxylesterase
VSPGPRSDGPPAPAPTVQRVETGDGVRLHALVWTPGVPGAAAPFVLVHGLASNAQLWTGVGAALARAGHPVVAVDLRSHGRSDPSDDLAFTTLTADLLAVTTAFGFERPVVVGQSWGGNVVLEHARRHPQALRAVVAIDGGTIELAEAFPDREACWAALAPPVWDGSRTLADVTATFDEQHPDWPTDGRRAQLGNLAVRPDGSVTAILTRARHRRIVEDLFDHRPSRILPEVTVPVLLLPVDTGDADWTARKQANAARAEAWLPRGRTVWLHDRDHDVHAQAPDEVAAVLLAHLADGFLDPDGYPSEAAS